MQHVDVYQVGYTSQEAFENKDKDKLALKYKGYVCVKDDVTNVADNAWHLCNWSCWTETKPDQVHTDLTFCNSDVIFVINDDEEEKEYWCADCFGWTVCRTLNAAIEHVKNRTFNLFKPIDSL